MYRKKFSFLLTTMKSGAVLCALLVTLVCWTNWQTVKADTNVGTVAVGANTFAVAVDETRNTVYVANQDSNNVTVINGTNNSTQTIAGGTSPYDAGVNQTTNRIYVINRGSANASVINGGNVSGQFDFDGDGKSDLSVFRPSNANWYINGSTSGFSAAQFGLATDKLAPADYDGDHKTDIAVWREGAFAYFYILQSSTNTFRAEQFGTTGDTPIAVGDWDGDGKADPAVYRNGASGGQSFFYYRPSAQPGVNYIPIQWGTGGDKAARGDFDGDGKMDAAIFRPTTNQWIIRQSSNGQVVYQQFGLATDKLVSADYDGDGKTDIAMFRPDNGTWYILQSSNN